MKFICNRNILLREIAIANEIIASKNVISILSNIYMETADEQLIIKSTDMKVNFETKVPVQVVESGVVTVFGDKFFGILNSVPDGDIEFEQSEGKITIKTMVKKAKFQLKVTSSEKYPEFSAPVNVFFEIPVKDFKNMILQTVFAVSDDETRYFMNGVFFEKSEDKINMVATDGRRLAYISKPAAGIHDFSGIIIPPKILNIIIKRAGDEGMIAISVTDKIIFLQFGPYKLSSVLIEGQFPNYRRVIPEKQENTFTINRLEILDALRRVSLLVEQNSHRVYLGLSSGMLSIFCEENEIGNAREEIPCKYDGEDITIALNYRYIVEPLKVIKSGEISIQFTEPTRAITINAVPQDDFFHIVMPMQVD